MDVIEALERRRTVRAFLPEPVPAETVRAILEAALRSPSWANTQPWEIYVAGGETLERIRAAFLERTRNDIPMQLDLAPPAEWPDACRERTRALTAGRAELAGVSVEEPRFRREFLENNRRFFGAPNVVYLCLDRCLTSWSVFDCGLLAQSIMLAAQGFGVDSAIAVNLVSYPDVLRSELGIPEELLVLIGIALGYPDSRDASEKFRSGRRSFDEAVTLAGV
jgi:nitroreductase